MQRRRLQRGPGPAIGAEDLPGIRVGRAAQIGRPQLRRQQRDGPRPAERPGQGRIRQPERRTPPGRTEPEHSARQPRSPGDGQLRAHRHAVDRLCQRLRWQAEQRRQIALPERGLCGGRIGQRPPGRQQAPGRAGIILRAPEDPVIADLSGFLAPSIHSVQRSCGLQAEPAPPEKRRRAGRTGNRIQPCQRSGRREGRARGIRMLRTNPARRLPV